MGTQPGNSGSASLRRSRSRNNSRYYLSNRNKSSNRKKKTNSHNLSGSNLYDRHRRNTKSRYQRSSSAPRCGKRKSRSSSPAVRFDPTAWAKEKKKENRKSRSIEGNVWKIAQSVA